MMKRQRQVDISVGFFMLFGLIAFFVMVMKVSGISALSFADGYEVTADFANIGGLKVRAPVSISGVRVGEVSKIELQEGALTARVTLQLRAYPPIPYDDVSARILTEGLLGSNYVSIVPGFDNDASNHPYLRAGDRIEKTQEAIVLENLIGQLLFSIKK
jgi:phospholipid/cholesterol/gamma-HCH transport system substrate-binding protein